MPINKSNNRWKLQWNWDCVAPNFDIDDNLEIITECPRQGILFDSHNNIISSSQENDFIYRNIAFKNFDKQPENGFIYYDITSQNFDKQLEDDLISLLNTKSFILENLIYIKYRGMKNIPLGFIREDKKNINKFSLDRIKNNHAISIKPKNCPRIYNSNLSKKSILEVKKYESKNPKLFGSKGGKLFLIKGDNRKILMKKNPTNGVDVFANYSFFNKPDSKNNS